MSSRRVVVVSDTTYDERKTENPYRRLLQAQASSTDFANIKINKKTNLQRKIIVSGNVKLSEKDETEIPLQNSILRQFKSADEQPVKNHFQSIIPKIPLSIKKETADNSPLLSSRKVVISKEDVGAGDTKSSKICITFKNDMLKSGRQLYNSEASVDNFRLPLCQPLQQWQSTSSSLSLKPHSRIKIPQLRENKFDIKSVLTDSVSNGKDGNKNTRLNMVHSGEEIIEYQKISEQIALTPNNRAATCHLQDMTWNQTRNGGINLAGRLPTSDESEILVKKTIGCSDSINDCFLQSVATNSCGPEKKTLAKTDEILDNFAATNSLSKKNLLHTNIPKSKISPKLKTNYSLSNVSILTNCLTSNASCCGGDKITKGSDKLPDKDKANLDLVDSAATKAKVGNSRLSRLVKCPLMMDESLTIQGKQGLEKKTENKVKRLVKSLQENTIDGFFCNSFKTNRAINNIYRAPKFYQKRELYKDDDYVDALSFMDHREGDILCEMHSMVNPMIKYESSGESQTSSNISELTSGDASIHLSCNPQFLETGPPFNISCNRITRQSHKKLTQKKRVCMAAPIITSCHSKHSKNFTYRPFNNAKSDFQTANDKMKTTHSKYSPTTRTTWSQRSHAISRAPKKNVVLLSSKLAKTNYESNSSTSCTGSWGKLTKKCRKLNRKSSANRTRVTKGKKFSVNIKDSPNSISVPIDTATQTSLPSKSKCILPENSFLAISKRSTRSSSLVNEGSDLSPASYSSDSLSSFSQKIKVPNFQRNIYRKTKCKAQQFNFKPVKSVEFSRSVSFSPQISDPQSTSEQIDSQISVFSKEQTQKNLYLAKSRCSFDHFIGKQSLRKKFLLANTDSTQQKFSASSQSTKKQKHLISGNMDSPAVESLCLQNSLPSSTKKTGSLTRNRQLQKTLSVDAFKSFSPITKNTASHRTVLENADSTTAKPHQLENIFISRDESIAFQQSLSPRDRNKNVQDSCRWTRRKLAFLAAEKRNVQKILSPLEGKLTSQNNPLILKRQKEYSFVDKCRDSFSSPETRSSQTDRNDSSEENSDFQIKFAAAGSNHTQSLSSQTDVSLAARSLDSQNGTPGRAGNCDFQSNILLQDSNSLAVTKSNLSLTGYTVTEEKNLSSDDVDTCCNLLQRNEMGSAVCTLQNTFFPTKNVDSQNNRISRYNKSKNSSKENHHSCGTLEAKFQCKVTRMKRKLDSGKVCQIPKLSRCFTRKDCDVDLHTTKMTSYGVDRLAKEQSSSDTNVENSIDVPMSPSSVLSSCCYTAAKSMECKSAEIKSDNLTNITLKESSEYKSLPVLPARKLFKCKKNKLLQGTNLSSSVSDVVLHENCGLMTGRKKEHFDQQTLLNESVLASFTGLPQSISLSLSASNGSDTSESVQKVSLEPQCRFANRQENKRKGRQKPTYRKNTEGTRQQIKGNSLCPRFVNFCQKSEETLKKESEKILGLVTLKSDVDSHSLKQDLMRDNFPLSTLTKEKGGTLQYGENKNFIKLSSGGPEKSFQNELDQSLGDHGHLNKFTSSNPSVSAVAPVGVLPNTKMSPCNSSMHISGEINRNSAEPKQQNQVVTNAVESKVIMTDEDKKVRKYDVFQQCKCNVLDENCKKKTCDGKISQSLKEIFDASFGKKANQSDTVKLAENPFALSCREPVINGLADARVVVGQRQLVQGSKENNLLDDDEDKLMCQLKKYLQQKDVEDYLKETEHTEFHAKESTASGEWDVNCTLVDNNLDSAILARISHFYSPSSFSYQALAGEAFNELKDDLGNLLDQMLGFIITSSIPDSRITKDQDNLLTDFKLNSEQERGTDGMLGGCRKVVSSQSVNSETVLAESRLEDGVAAEKSPFHGARGKKRKKVHKKFAFTEKHKILDKKSCLVKDLSKKFEKSALIDWEKVEKDYPTHLHTSQLEALLQDNKETVESNKVRIDICNSVVSDFSKSNKNNDDFSENCKSSLLSTTPGERKGDVSCITRNVSFSLSTSGSLMSKKIEKVLDINLDPVVKIEKLSFNEVICVDEDKMIKKGSKNNPFWKMLKEKKKKKVQSCIKLDKYETLALNPVAKTCEGKNGGENKTNSKICDDSRFSSLKTTKTACLTDEMVLTDFERAISGFTNANVKKTKKSLLKKTKKFKLEKCDDRQNFSIVSKSQKSLNQPKSYGITSRLALKILREKKRRDEMKNKEVSKTEIHSKQDITSVDMILSSLQNPVYNSLGSQSLDGSKINLFSYSQIERSCLSKEESTKKIEQQDLAKYSKDEVHEIQKENHLESETIVKAIDGCGRSEISSFHSLSPEARKHTKESLECFKESEKNFIKKKIGTTTPNQKIKGGTNKLTKEMGIKKKLMQELEELIEVSQPLHNMNNTKTSLVENGPRFFATLENEMKEKSVTNSSLTKLNFGSLAANKNFKQAVRLDYEKKQNFQGGTTTLSFQKFFSSDDLGFRDFHCQEDFQKTEELNSNNQKEIHDIQKEQRAVGNGESPKEHFCTVVHENAETNHSGHEFCTENVSKSDFLHASNRHHYEGKVTGKEEPMENCTKESVFSNFDDNESSEDSDGISIFAPSEASFLLDSDEEQNSKRFSLQVKQESLESKDYVDMGGRYEAADLVVKVAGGKPKSGPSNEFRQCSSQSGSINKPLQKQMDPQKEQSDVITAVSDMKIPDGYCFNFVKKGICPRTNCPYMHATPSLNESCLWNLKQACSMGHIDRAFKVFGQLQMSGSESRIPFLHPLIKLCFDHDDADKAFALIHEICQHQLLTGEICNTLFNICSAAPQRYSEQLWALFKTSVMLNLQPSMEALSMLLMLYFESRDWPKVWEIAAFASEYGYFHIPSNIQVDILYAAINDPASFLEPAAKWLGTCTVDELVKMDKEMLSTLGRLCSQNGYRAVGLYLNEVCPSEICAEKSEKLEDFSFEEENHSLEEDHVKNDEFLSYCHCIKGCQISRNWTYLAEIYLDICCGDKSLKLSWFVKAFSEALINISKPEVMMTAFQEFIIHVMKVKSKEQRYVMVDKKCIALIAKNLLVACYDHQYWNVGYGILYKLHKYGIQYCKFQTRTSRCNIILIAIEIFIQVEQPQGALEIMDGLKLFHSKDSMFSSHEWQQLDSLIRQLIKQLAQAKKFTDAGRVLCLIVRRSVESPNNIGITDREKAIFNNLIIQSLAIHDVQSAVFIFNSFKPVIYQTSMDVAVCRSLLVATASVNLWPVVNELYSLCKRQNIYPSQELVMPWCIKLNSIWTVEEMKIIVEDYLENIYNTICTMIMHGHQITQHDLELYFTVQFTWNNNVQQTPYLTKLPRSLFAAYQMVMKILQYELRPPLEAKLNTVNGYIQVLDRSFKNYLKVLDSNRRCQGLDFCSDVPVSGKRRPRRNRNFIQ